MAVADSLNNSPEDHGRRSVRLFFVRTWLLQHLVVQALTSCPGRVSDRPLFPAAIMSNSHF